MIKQEIFNDLTTVLGNKILKKEDGFYFDDTKIIFPEELPLLDIASDKDKYIYYDTEDGCEFLLKKLDYGYDTLVEDSKISISFSELSDGLCFYLLNEFSKQKIRVFMPSIRLRRILDRTDGESVELFDLLRLAFSEYCALVVKAKNKPLPTNIIDIAKSHLFNCSMLLGYNFCLVEKGDLSFLSRTSTGRLIRRTKVETPHKKYNEEMVQYYIEAKITRVPKIQFLSFFNVLEYYADELNEDKICEQIQNIVTDPHFKQSKVKEYRKVSKIFDVKNIFDDGQALLVLLNSYINKDKLLEFLDKNPFYTESSAYKIKETILKPEDSNLIAKVKKRIYGVRNALVHSKEGNSVKYTPLKDDLHITEEIPLIKFLAEQIIINSGTIMDY